MGPDYERPGFGEDAEWRVADAPEAGGAAGWWRDYDDPALAALVEGEKIDRVAGMESRGFIFGGPLGLDMDKPMVLMRKAGKLPAKVRSVTYDLEYGQATLEAHVDSFQPGDKVVIVDDLLATGGTAAASAQLVRDAGAEVAAYLFLVELEFLKGRKALGEDAPVLCLVKYD